MKDHRVAAKNKELVLEEEEQHCMIEELRDDILCLIISFLTMKEAICTSILSRRWRNLYLSMSRLNIDGTFILPKRDVTLWVYQDITFFRFVGDDPEFWREIEDLVIRCWHDYLNAKTEPISIEVVDDDFQKFFRRAIIAAIFGADVEDDNEEFVGLVDQFLYPYLNAQIKSFRLAFPYPDHDNINRWIRTAIQMGVEDLDLIYLRPHFRLKPGRKFPEFIISFQTILDVPLPLRLKHLHLCHCYINPTISESHVLHSLETMELEDLSVDNSVLECIFSTCVNLHKLKLRKCKFGSQVRICFPSIMIRLKCLQIFNHEQLEKIEVSGTTELIYFEYWNPNPSVTEFSFSNVPKLEEFRLDSQLWHQRVDDIFSDFPNDAPQLKKLLLPTELDIKLEPLLPVTTNILHQIEELELTVSSCCCLLNMIPILVACPMLLKFHLAVFGRPAKGPSMKRTPSKHPFLKLKQVNITGFYSATSKTDFALYVLENAMALEQLILDTTPGLRRCHGCRFKHFSHELPRQMIRGKVASPMASLIIKHHSHENIDFAKVFMAKQNVNVRSFLEECQ